MATFGCSRNQVSSQTAMEVDGTAGAGSPLVLGLPTGRMMRADAQICSERSLLSLCTSAQMHVNMDAGELLFVFIVPVVAPESAIR